MGEKLTEADQIVVDLIAKVGSDVSTAIKLAASLVPAHDALPIALAAVGSALAFAAACLDERDPLPPFPSYRTVLTAALLSVRAVFPEDGVDPADSAAADVAALEAAGRQALDQNGGEK